MEELRGSAPGPVGIGIDPGEKYSAAVLADADGRPINGFTIGPTDNDGLLDRLAHSNLDPDTEVFVAAIYSRRFLAHLAPLYWQAAELSEAPPQVAVEKITRTDRRDIPPRAWLFPWTVMHYVCAVYNDVALVPCKGRNHGLRHQKSRGGNGKVYDYYPPGLHRGRPEGWGVNEHYRGARNHERAAYDVLMRARKLSARAATAAEVAS